MDRNRESAPDRWSLVREKALTTGLCSEGWCCEHSGLCRRAELPGRRVYSNTVKVEKFWKADGGLTRNDLKAKGICLCAHSHTHTHTEWHTRTHTHTHTKWHTHTTLSRRAHACVCVCVYNLCLWLWVCHYCHCVNQNESLLYSWETVVTLCYENLL